MVITAPFLRVGESHLEWERIGASPWLIRQLLFGLQLPWISKPKIQRKSVYPLEPVHREFAEREVQRWVSKGFLREANPTDGKRLIRRGQVSPAFVTTTTKRLRLVVDYSVVNKSLEERTFRMDQLGDLAVVLAPKDCLFRDDISDAYYHLQLRKCDQERLAFRVGSRVLIPLCLNSGLSVAPWFFTKAMRPVVAYLREKGHRAFAYLDDFFGSTRSSSSGPTNHADTIALGLEMQTLFCLYRPESTPGQMRLQRQPSSGDSGNSGRHGGGTFLAQLSQADQNRGSRTAATSVRFTAPPPCARQ